MRKICLFPFVLLLMVFLTGSVFAAEIEPDRKAAETRKESAQTEIVLSRLRQTVNTVIPRKIKNLPKERDFNYRISSENKYSVFRGKTGSSVELPAKFEDWTADPHRLREVIAEMLLCRIGVMGGIHNFPEPWLIEAVLYDGLQPFLPQEGVEYPFVRGMLSGGIMPDLRNFLNNQPEIPEGFYGAAFAEWSRVLFALCSKGNILRSGAMEKYLLQRLAAMPSGKSYDIFETWLFPRLAEQFTAAAGGVRSSPQEWLSCEAPKVIFSRTAPMSAFFAESRFSAICEPLFSGLLKEQKPPYKAEIQIALSRIIFLLRELSGCVSEDISLQIRAFAMTVEHVRSGMFKDFPETALSESAKRVYITMENRAALEKKLAEAETKYIPPSVRHGLSFHAADSVKTESGVFEQAEKLMDRYEKR